MFYSRSRAKKRLGQNFLIEKNVSSKIVSVSGINSESTVFEIGPGYGILTRELLAKAKKVIAVELDKKLLSGLQESLRGFKNIKLIQGNILKIDIRVLIKELRVKEPITVVSNIPYNITSPILGSLFDSVDLFNNIFLMVQREFALRLTADPDTKEYSSITCFTRFYSDPKLLFPVKRTCFRPQPKVDSYFIRLTPIDRMARSIEFRPKNRDLLFKLIRSAFSHRRKNILNSLSKVVDKDKLQEVFDGLNLDWRKRAENLSVEDYIRISNKI